MKRMVLFLVAAGLTAFLSGQSLTDAARAERARRQSLGGRHGPVVTKAELLKVKLRPAVEVVIPVEGTEATEALSVEREAEPAGGVADQASAPVGGPEAAPAPEGAPDAISGLREKLRSTEELIELLKTKIAVLNQDYASRANMVPASVIEQQLTETLQKLQAAQAEAVRIEREIGRLALENRALRNARR